MAEPRRFRCAALSAVKHDYVARGLISHGRFELVVVADDPSVPAWAHERNQQLADAFRVPYVRDVERALADYRVDVAIVSSEAERHCELSVRAAVLGIHVVQDKPMSTRRTEADRLVRAVDASGVRFMMWNRNFVPAVVQAKQQIDSGAIGKVMAVHIDFYFAKDGGPPKGSRAPGFPPLDWYGHQIAAHADGSDGGLGREPMGEITNEGIYPLGYLRALTGLAVRRVFARATAHVHQLYVDNAIEDLGSMTLELEGGAVGTIALGRIGAASHPSGGEMKIRVIGDTGALVVNESCPTVEIHYRDQPAKEHRQRRVANENDLRLADHFAQAIDTGAGTIMDAHASLAIFATCAAAIESSRTGRVIAVDG